MKMLVVVTVVLGFLIAGNARPIEVGEERKCRVGNVSLPMEIFESYAGWECYEETYPKRLMVHVCVEKSGNAEYSVPCFKAGAKMMSFNLRNEDTVLEMFETFGSLKLNDEMIRCYLSLVSACEISSDEWLGKGFILPVNITEVCDLDGQSKFHIAMLSVSLIVGVPVLIVHFIWSWIAASEILAHCRNLMTALVLRTFFTLLIETQVVSQIIQSPGEEFVSWAGCKALVSFETIASNLVAAFCLIFVFYLVEYSKYGFEREPDVRLGSYILSGFSLALPIVWMIIMGAGDYGMCWMEKTPVNWVNDSLRIGCILAQLVLLSSVAYRVFTGLTAFNDPEKYLLRRVWIFGFVSSCLFLIQFSLNAAHPLAPQNGYVYAEYFFDGLQCGMVALLFVFKMQALIPLKLYSFIRGLRRNKKCHVVLETAGSGEKVIGGAPKTVDKPAENHSSDVIYSSILTPERFEKTIKLYNRLNQIPRNVTPAISEDVTRNNPENSSVISEYYDVDNDSIRTAYEDVADYSTMKSNNRYYNSRYLVHDSTDASSSDDSVKEPAKVEVSSVSSSENFHREHESVKFIENWLENYCCQDVAAKSKSENRTIRRSLSGNLFSSKEIPTMVEINLKTSEKLKISPALGGSSPSIAKLPGPNAYCAALRDRPQAIYDDLKRHRDEFKSRTRGGNVNYGTDRSKYKNRPLRNLRRAKSMDAVEGPEKEQLDIQLNALLSPGWDLQQLKPGDLRKNKFYNTEHLNTEGETGT